MLLIICVERLLHIGSHFSLRKWRRRPHFPIKLAAVAYFPTKLEAAECGLIFLQDWRQGFGNITGGCSDMVWILDYRCISNSYISDKSFNNKCKPPLAMPRGKLLGTS